MVKKVQLTPPETTVAVVVVVYIAVFLMSFWARLLLITFYFILVIKYCVDVIAVGVVDVVVVIGFCLDLLLEPAYMAKQIGRSGPEGLLVLGDDYYVFLS